MRIVDDAHARFDLKSARAADPEHAFDSGDFCRCNDRRRSSDLVDIEIRVLPARVEGTDQRIVTLDQLCKGTRVINVTGF